MSWFKDIFGVLWLSGVRFLCFRRFGVCLRVNDVWWL